MPLNWWHWSSPHISMYSLLFYCLHFLYLFNFRFKRRLRYLPQVIRLVLNKVFTRIVAKSYHLFVGYSVELFFYWSIYFWKRGLLVIDLEWSCQHRHWSLSIPLWLLNKGKRSFISIHCWRFTKIKVVIAFSLSQLDFLWLSRMKQLLLTKCVKLVLLLINL